MSISIPSVDLNDFAGSDPMMKKNFSGKLGEAFEQVGFVAVKNHGLTHELITDLYDQVKRFFELPEAIKKQYEIPGLGGQRGYTPFGREHAKGSNAGDLKEFWHFGQEVSDGDPIRTEYPENISVTELPAFNEAGLATYRALENCGIQLLRAIALHLELEENYFDRWVHNGNSILRPIHYPPITSEPESAIRAGAHEDINLITLLIGASAEGLEILNKQDQWVAVTSVD
ncbi:MAG: 2-oxoglutarate and iron-dependent oxygenase domain-containing protein, partial [Bacteroidota bacterium]